MRASLESWAPEASGQGGERQGGTGGSPGTTGRDDKRVTHTRASHRPKVGQPGAFPGGCHTVLGVVQKDQAMVDSSDSGSAMPPTGLDRAELWGGLTRLMTVPGGEANTHACTSGRAKQKPQGTGTRAAPDLGHRDTDT